MTEINSIANRIMHIVRAIRLDINTGGSSEDLILRRVDGIEKLATELMAAPSRNEMITLASLVTLCLIAMVPTIKPTKDRNLKRSKMMDM